MEMCKTRPFYARIGLNVAQDIEMKVKLPLNQGYITQF